MIVYPDEDLADLVRDLTGGRGADVAYDAVGRDTFRASLDALRPLGHLISYGQASGAIPPFDIHLLAENGGRFLARAAFNQYIGGRDDLLARSAEIFGCIESGDLTLRIAGTYDLADARRAHEALATRTVTGKLLLAVP